jgi:glycyl-tRNA synthetase beta chain
MIKDALLEIGSEELPASFVTFGMKQLKALAEASLKENGLSFKTATVYGTPRRLAITIEDLIDRSPDQSRVVTGPPVAAAKDAQGQWTPAALGFARKHGLKPSDLTVEKDRLIATLHIKGTPTRQLLSDLFPSWIARLEFPKSMVWEPSKFRFPRPIRWIAALYGSDLVSFQLAGVRSARWTLGLGGESPKKTAITQPGKYAVMRKNQCVLVDPAARQEAIQRQAEQAAKRVHGHPLLSDALLEQVSNLVEHPVAVLGGFDAAYLELPSEVLITCLEHHQRFFPVAADKGGKLLAQFIGIRNGMSVHQDTVREGYERVLAARLADARFFFKQDRRTPLSAKRDALQGVMFQAKLGSVHDKVERVKRLLHEFALLLPGEKMADGQMRGFPLDQALRAADLGKADLVTDMVREFPELQGIMARIYAGLDGEDSVVAQAAEQHYWPITLTGKLPETDAAAALALADKLDTLAGDFAIGLIPTGSADPYGLRRAAVGILRILEERKWPLSLDTLIAKAIDLQPENTRDSAGETRTKLVSFMRQRLSAVLEERGVRSDEIDAVLEPGLHEIPDILARLTALRAVRAGNDFEALSVAFKRAANIVRQAAKSGAGMDGAVQQDLLKEPAERQLFETLERVGQEATRLAGEHEYEKALSAMAPLREPLDAFFTGVMVMAEDAALRANRLSLMKRLVSEFSRIADFSKLQNA